jgi:hypothetical protein
MVQTGQQAGAFHQRHHPERARSSRAEAFTFRPTGITGGSNITRRDSSLNMTVICAPTPKSGDLDILILLRHCATGPLGLQLISGG